MSFHKSIIASGATSTPAASVEFNLKREGGAVARPQPSLPQPPSSSVPISTEHERTNALLLVAPISGRSWGL